MKIVAALFLLACVFGFAASAQNPAAPLSVDLKAADGTPLKATYFVASRPGPGLLLLHQSNRDRKSWDSLAAQLANAGINTLTLDMRGFGESGGEKRGRVPEDVETALEFFRSQTGVNRNVIGLG